MAYGVGLINMACDSYGVLKSVIGAHECHWSTVAMIGHYIIYSPPLFFFLGGPLAPLKMQIL